MPVAHRQFHLPDLISISSAFTDATNPHWKRASAESRAWVNSYNVFSDRRRAFFLQGQSELLGSHAWPYAGYEEFRTCCDFVNLLFVIDEISDLQGPDGARQTGQIFLNVLNDAEWDDGSKVAKLSKDVRNRLTSTGIKPNTYRRFVQCATNYIESVVEEAGLRERGEVVDMNSYESLRRNNSAVPTCFALIPYCLHIDLPDEVVEDPVFQRINFAGIDMVCWANDLYSYNMEQAKGLEGNNIITVLTKSHGLTLQQAVDKVGMQYRKWMEGFIADKSQLRSFGPELDADVHLCISKMTHWCIGNLVWSFETPRYFGSKREQIKETGIVVLKPREEDEDDGYNL